MLSMLKKITAGIVAAAICAVPLTLLQVTAESSSEEAAVVTFGKYIRTKNVKNWEFNLWDNAERVVRDGREGVKFACLLYTSPSPRDGLLSRMPSSA